MTSSLRIFGIGSPHGADRVGWLVAQSLSERADLEASVTAVRTPLEMLDFLDGCESLLIVDACVTGAAAGTVFRISWPDDRFDSEQKLSSHGLGVVEVLQLANQLGRLPASVMIYCLEVDGNRHESAESVPGLAELERCVIEEASRFATERRESRERQLDA